MPRLLALAFALVFALGARAEDGSTPLHFACENAYAAAADGNAGVALVRALLEACLMGGAGQKGAAGSAVDGSGRTPLDRARAGAREALRACFRAAGEIAE